MKKTVYMTSKQDGLKLHVLLMEPCLLYTSKHFQKLEESFIHILLGRLHGHRQEEAFHVMEQHMPIISSEIFHVHDL